MGTGPRILRSGTKTSTIGRDRGDKRRANPEMKVHEYQAKDLLKAAGVAVPAGVVATTPDEAAGGLRAARRRPDRGESPGPRRGPRQGGRDRPRRRPGRGPQNRQRREAAPPRASPRACSSSRSKEDARKAAESLLHKTLITYQTGIDGAPINKVLVTVGHDIVKELYLGLAVDRGLQCPVLMASTEGGVEIETVAHDHPEKIHKEPIDVGLGLLDFQAPQGLARPSD